MTEPKTRKTNPPSRARLAFRAMARVDKAMARLKSAEAAKTAARVRIEEAQAELTAARSDAAQFADLLGEPKP